MNEVGTTKYTVWWWRPLEEGGGVLGWEQKGASGLIIYIYIYIYSGGHKAVVPITTNWSNVVHIYLYDIAMSKHQSQLLITLFYTNVLLSI